MFREMRRFKQQLSMEECADVLRKEKRAVLAVNGDEGYPYCLPLNYYYDSEDSCIYFHCAREGHKIDSILKDDRVCLEVHEKGEQREDWSYYVRSVIVFGRAEIMEESEEKYEKAALFGEKYFPTKEDVELELKHSYARVNMVRIRIEHMTGKLVHEK